MGSIDGKNGDRRSFSNSVNLGKLVLGILSTLFVGACATVRVEEAPSEVQAMNPDKAWAEILAEYVDDKGQVNFRALNQKPQRLKLYVHYISKNGPKTRPDLFATPDAKLAYYLNSYNALSMYNVLDSGLPKSLYGFKKATFFYFKKFIVDGEKMSLYTYENEVIRKLGEERIHFALNCMSRGCPRLPRKPFPSTGLIAVLEAGALEFFNEERNVKVNAEKKEVAISEILAFFPDDFLAKSPSLIAYVNKYRKEKVPEDYTVSFIPYDWNVNHQSVAAPENKVSARSQHAPGEKS